LNEEKYPFVLIDRTIPDLKANTVGVDNFKGSYEAITHLIKQGYKNIAAFSVSPVHVSTINDRINGYLRCLKDNNLSYGKKLLVEIPFNDVKNSVKFQLSNILYGKEKVGAIFAINNNIGITCLEALNEMRVQVPEDIGFVCFDDLEIFRFGRPTITAVSQPIEDICKNAVEILLNEIKNKEHSTEKQQIKLPTSLIIRRSTVN